MSGRRCASIKSKNSSSGYTVEGTTFDALVLGYYEGKKLTYAGRTRNGLTPALRAQLLNKLHPLQIRNARLPISLEKETPMRPWTYGGKDEELPLGKSVLVGQFEFLEWTDENDLRHSKFIALRDDKTPQKMRMKGRGILRFRDRFL